MLRDLLPASTTFECWSLWKLPAIPQYDPTTPCMEYLHWDGFRGKCNYRHIWSVWVVIHNAEDLVVVVNSVFTFLRRVLRSGMWSKIEVRPRTAPKTCKNTLSRTGHFYHTLWPAERRPAHGAVHMGFVGCQGALFITALVRRASYGELNIKPLAPPSVMVFLCISARLYRPKPWNLGDLRTFNSNIDHTNI